MKTVKKRKSKGSTGKVKRHGFRKGFGSTELTTTKSAKLSTAKPPKKDDGFLMTAMAIGAAGLLGLLGWDYVHRKKTAHFNNDNSGVTNTNPIPTNDTNAKTTDTPPQDTTFKKKFKHETGRSSGGFPLKRGSKGEKVRKVQQALLDKYGSEILPKYGADGDFGSEMAAALKKLGLPATISKSSYEVIVQGSSNQSGNNKSELASKLYMAVQSGNLDNVLTQLKQIESKEDYRHVSNNFKENYRVNGVHQTLVNAMLDSFSDEGQKQQIRYEFLRMGLQYDGNRWSLSGTDGHSIITTIPTTVWASDGKTINVPANMVLGNEINCKSGFTRFENNRYIFFVLTSAVKHL